MDKVFQGPAKLPAAAAPRFTLGCAAGGSLVACLWLWTSAGALAAVAPSPSDAASASAYRNALDSFNHGDASRALTLLEHAPTTGGASEQADILNLRGAIYLRQHRYESAQAEFARATQTDRTLWAARFNTAEVSFRQKHYAESRQQFAALLDQTSRLFHSEEYHFVQYKLLLAGICAGDEKPALDFIAGHREDEQRPLAWYYLNAALEHQRERSPKADQWLAQADTKYTTGAGQAYAESFDRLGWGADRSEISGGGDAWHNARNLSLSDNTATKPRPAHAPVAGPGDSRSPTKTVAVVQVLPEPAKVSFRDSSPASTARTDYRSGTAGNTPPEGSETPSASDLPPVSSDALAAFEDSVRAEHDARPGPAPLARPRKSHATPDPSASPDSSPGAATANQGGSPTPAAVSTATPSEEFMGKYEAAYAKFLQKDYPGTLAALDEADKVQPGQAQSISLRFKSHYALAYIEYRKQNYPGALAHLDDADQTQKNADSYNLRGLIFSKQHNYDQAEGMFHKAIVTDPALWAAKFNYAELPFNRGNYTDARTRFEELFSQTDAAKQPREAELTQYKVFLTLLLEGKVEAASTFMDHLNFSGATPARYFCNAALNFRAGSVDKAKNWIDDAKKEFPPQLVAIFIESFYRLGWMADPNAPAGTAVAQVTPAGTPAVTTSGTLPTTVATATAAPTPITMAAASPTPTPLGTPSAPPRPAASAPPAVVVASPAATPARPAPSASVAPGPAVSATPLIAAIPSVGPARPAVLPSATPTPATASPHPAASVPAVVVVPTPVATPLRPVASATITPTPANNPVSTPATAQATPSPAATEPPTEAAAATSEEQTRKKNRLHLILLIFALAQTLYYVTRMRALFLRRKQQAMRAAARRREAVESSK